MGDVLLETGLMHYEAVGRGKPLLFLHDWVGSSRYWIPIMMDIASAYRGYALDFWGFGASDKISTSYTIDGYLDQAVTFITQMGIEHVPVVGHGLGGIVGVTLAAEYPGQVSQVLAISMPLTEACVSRALSSFHGSDNTAKSILGRRLKAYEEVAMEAAKIDSQAVIQSLNSTMAVDLIETLEDVAMPVLLIYGKHDPLVDPPDDEIVKNLEDNVRTLVLKSAQHYPMLEDATIFKRFLLRFLMHQDNWEAVLKKQERWIWGA